MNDEMKPLEMVPVSTPIPSPKLVWEQMEGEPDGLYANFLKYLNLGSSRTLEKAFDECVVIKRRGNSRKKDSKTSGTFWLRAKTWNWIPRAQAWDLHWQKQEFKRIETAREKSLQHLEEATEQIAKMIKDVAYAEDVAKFRSQLQNLTVLLGKGGAKDFILKGLEILPPKEKISGGKMMMVEFTL